MTTMEKAKLGKLALSVYLIGNENNRLREVIRKKRRLKKCRILSLAAFKHLLLGSRK